MMRHIALTSRERYWLVIALRAGYDGFSSRVCPTLLRLVRRRLIERNPCSHGVHTQWRAALRTLDNFKLRNGSLAQY